ncbi:serine hydrolase [Qipengyuania sp. MTN3-11]|uniref:serine hydrolase n=1 Tax=Qipengyuania sp. MTN3-11 TaxID=3056557 RepID=UPI0036F2D9BB
MASVAPVSPAFAAPPADLAQEAEELREEFGAPGLTIGIVEGGEVTFAQGFGVTDIEAPRQVTADTNFAIGSVTKAFTATGLAALVDQGKLDWDDPVIDHMPEFRMHDAWVTRQMTVRDLLVHRSGLALGAGDLLFVPRSDLTRADVVERLGNIPLSTSFRSAYAYDNILYMVAGRLIERVSGMSWEDFVTAEVLRPAGMARATVENDDRGDPALVAHPHARISGPVRGLGEIERLDDEVVVAQVAAPAGGIAASANDMVKWIKTQLAQGQAPDGTRVFSEETAREMWQPVVLMPTGAPSGPLAETAPMFNTYALGWSVRDYRGAKIVSHGGGVYGSITRLVLIPDRNVGFFIATNSEESALLTGLQFELLDHYLGAPEKDWTAIYDEYLDQRLESARVAVVAASAETADVGPSLPLSGYAGTYSDPWFGNISIAERAGKLSVTFPHWEGVGATLEHHQYDTFIARFSDPGVEPAYMTFALDAEGDVARITMKAVSPAADFSFDYHDLDFTPVQPD